MCWLTISQSVSISAEDFSRRGPAAVSERTVPIVRSNGSLCEAVVWYPAVEAGSRQPLDRRQAPYPVVVFASPVVPIPWYAQTQTHLASWGFIVIAPSNSLRLFPDQPAIADDLRVCLDFLAEEHRRPQSVFYGVVDTERAAFCGHSWGGACSILAGVKEPTRVKVVVNYACWNRSIPSPQSCVHQLGCPLIMLTGDSDMMTPLSTVQAIYDTAVTQKSLIIVRGGIHFGFVDHWFFEPATAVRQVDVARHYTTVALLVHLRGKTSLSPLLWNPQAAPFGDVTRHIESME